MLLDGDVQIVEGGRQKDGLDEDHAGCQWAREDLRDRRNGCSHGMPHDQGFGDSQTPDEGGQVVGQNQPAQAPVLRVGRPVVAEVRRYHPEAPGQFPGDRMPEPGPKTGGVEQYHGRSVAGIMQILQFGATDVSR